MERRAINPWAWQDQFGHSQAQVNENYLGNYSRLVELKRRYDPTNLFRLNANVIPDAEQHMDKELRATILGLLDQHRILTLATLRPDGWPQATTVGYVNEGLNLYFLCGLESQKASNLVRDNRVSLTIDHDTPNIMAITGLSMAARAFPVTDRAEAERILRLLPTKYPEQTEPLPVAMPTPEQVRIFRLEPVVISVLDYRKGFGHTDLVTCT